MTKRASSSSESDRGSRSTYDQRWLAGLHERLAVALAGTSHNAIARLTGYNSETVRRYRSKTEPSARFLAQVCDVFGVNACWLLHGTGQMSLAAERQAVADALDFASVLTLLGRRLSELDAKLDAMGVQQVEVKPAHRDGVHPSTNHSPKR